MVPSHNTNGDFKIKEVVQTEKEMLNTFEALFMNSGICAWQHRGHLF